VATCDPKTTPLPQIAEMMIGKTADPIRRVDAYVGGVRLKVDNLSVKVPEGTSLNKVNLDARRGEILAVAGVAGEGQEALFSALSGEITTRRGKAITLSDKPIGTLGPTARRRLGIAFARFAKLLMSGRRPVIRRRRLSPAGTCKNSSWGARSSANQRFSSSLNRLGASMPVPPALSAMS